MSYNDLGCFYQSLVAKGLAQHVVINGLECYRSNTFGYPNLCATNANENLEENLRGLHEEYKTEQNIPRLLLLGPEVDKDNAHAVCGKYDFGYSGYWENMELLVSERYLCINNLHEPSANVIQVLDEVLMDQCIALVNKVLFPGKELSTGVMSVSLLSEDLIWYCVLEDKCVISTLLLYLNSQTQSAGVYMVCTDPKYQRQGLGRILMLHGINHANRKLCTRIILQSTKEGRRLYRKLGFKPLGLYGLYTYRGNC